MRYDSSAKKAFIEKSSPEIIDTVRFHNRYINARTVKGRATGIISALIFTGFVAFSFFYFLLC